MVSSKVVPVRCLLGVLSRSTCAAALSSTLQINLFSPSFQTLQKTLARRAALPSKRDLISNANYDYNNSKYAELFITPPPNPNMYSFDSSLPAYPLDTVIPSYPLPAPQKSQNGGMEYDISRANSEPEDMTKSPTAELENLLKPESDLLSLLSLPTASNSDPQDSMSDFAIPSASGGIFDMFPVDMLQETPPPAQPQMKWQEEEGSLEPQQQSPPQAEQLPSEMMPLPLAQDQSQYFWMTPSPHTSTSSPSQLTPLLDAFPALDHDITLPGPSVSPTHPSSLLPGGGEGGGGANEGGLSIEEQMNFLDSSFDLEDFFPPAKKLQEFAPAKYSEVPSPSSHMNISPAPTPLPSSPLTPADVDVKPVISPDSPPGATESPDKPKPTPLLFGKHEDEILHKLLVPQRSPGSRPITRDKLVSMPVEEFNRLLESASLSEIEVAFMKEWRRRGKNKTAAMVARKRKRDELSDLDEEVSQLRKQKGGLQAKYDRLRSDIVALKERTRAAEERVYRRYSRQSGAKVSRETHMIHVEQQGDKVMLVPRLPQQMLLVK